MNDNKIDHTRTIIKIGLISGAIVIILWILTPIFLHWIYQKGANDTVDVMAKRGQFGDMYGSITSLFSGITIIGLLITIFLQREDIKIANEALEQQKKDLEVNTKAIALATSEMELSKEAIKNSTIELKNQLKLQKHQRFDNTLFNILKLNENNEAPISQINSCVDQFLIIGGFESTKDAMLTQFNKNVHVSTREKIMTYVNSMVYLLRWICSEKSVNGKGREKYFPLVFAQLRKSEKIFLFYYFNIVLEEQLELEAFEKYLVEYPMDERMNTALSTFRKWRGPIKE